MTQHEALTIMKTGANVFLTGEPGAGKTHTVNAYVSYLREHGVEPAITASTGIAATHIHGQTIHSWSGIGIKRVLTRYDLDHITTTEYLVKRIQKTKVLILDELSMIDATTLDMVDLVCREVKQCPDPFGGMQVILVGDFFQLPPITRFGEEARFAFEALVWKNMAPVVCYLTEQHRQSDRHFLSLLSAIRKNTYDQDHHDHLEKRLINHADAVAHTSTVTRLFSHNTDVDDINMRELTKLSGIPTRYSMTSKGKDSLVANLQKGCLSPEVLELKQGAIVMCTKNNTQKGYVNGTLGTVVKFEAGTKYPVIETKTGERIVVEPMDWVVEENGKQKASITQIPLRLAWAITIHKSQGMSMDAAVMDLREVFEYGQGYVALSRVRTLDGLHLLGWNERTFQVHPHILTMDSALVRQSEAAAATFGDMRKDDIEIMHRNFILASGGTVDTVKKAKKKMVGDTLETTLALVLQEKSIEGICKERALTPVTILGHIEKLVDAKRLAYEDIEYLIDDKVLRGLADIKETFITLDTSKLSPVFEHYKGKYTYEQIRFARML
ncbi:MAG: AAA family ATPase, partial [Candidatus Pacebacteria bacterium]|nr:AAA family ATPase [Candidatus Paceibacterota bacterium]MBP9701234.1 AAA family ATPase [Candidatus Paceibacterota bacterium]